jgi:hypothetical protein
MVMALFLAACGGGIAKHIEEPMVRGFSPVVSPIDFNTLQQNPTFTNGMLTDSIDPNYPGKIVIIFQHDTILDPSSVFTGGDPLKRDDLMDLLSRGVELGLRTTVTPSATPLLTADAILERRQQYRGGGSYQRGERSLSTTAHGGPGASGTGDRGHPPG